MKFTKEEIALCRKIAEKHRKEIEVGDWYLLDKKLILVAWSNRGFLDYKENIKDCLPLWQISDCLEFLRERGFTIIQACEHSMSHEWIIEINPYESNAVKTMGHKSFEVRGGVILEALLKAVLAILEES